MDALELTFVVSGVGERNENKIAHDKTLIRCFKPDVTNSWAWSFAPCSAMSY